MFFVLQLQLIQISWEQQHSSFSSHSLIPHSFIQLDLLHAKHRYSGGDLNIKENLYGFCTSREYNRVGNTDQTIINHLQ